MFTFAEKFDLLGAMLIKFFLTTGQLFSCRWSLILQFMPRVELTVILLLLVPDPLKRFLQRSEVFAANIS